MRIAVAGATGTVGRLVAQEATDAGHDVVGLARSLGADLLTGTGLDLTGVEAVIDASGVATLSARTSRAFFRTATTNLLTAAHRAGVRHLVTLSIVGARTNPHGYYAGKARQEEIIEASDVPSTIVRSTQFFEFAEQNAMNLGFATGLPVMRSQPLAASAVAKRLVEIVTESPRTEPIELAGAAGMTMAEVLRAIAAAHGERKRVIEIALPGRFGRALRDGSILPAAGVEILGPSLAEWIASR